MSLIRTPDRIRQMYLENGDALDASSYEVVDLCDEVERLQAENADLLCSLRVQIGFAVARTEDERAAVSRAYQKARQI